MAAVIGALRAELSANVAKFERDLGKAAKSVRGLQGTLRDVSAGSRAAGTALTAGVTLPIIGVGTAAVVSAVKFNKGMADVATLIPGATDRVTELKVAVQGMAVAHGKDTTDLARGLYQTISAFGDEAGRTVKILEINSKAAAAGLASTEQAIALTSAVTKAYGDTSAEAVQRVSDLAFTTVRLGQTTFPELAASMGRVVPIAEKMNVTQEELAATFATLTGVTGNTAEVSTQLASVLTGFVKPSAQMKKAIKGLVDEHGRQRFATAEAMIAELGLVGALNAVIGTTDGTSESVGKLLGRKEALVAAFALTGAQADTFAAKLDAMQDVVGATDEAFREQTEGVNAAGFAWEQIKALFQTTSQRIGDVLLPALLDLAETMKPLGRFALGLVERFESMDPIMQKVVIGVAALTAAIGPLLLVVATLAAGIGAMLPLFAVGLPAAAAALTASLAPLAIAIGVGAAAWGAWKFGKWIGKLGMGGLDKASAKLTKTLDKLDKEAVFAEKTWRSTAGVIEDADLAMENLGKAVEAGDADIFDLDATLRRLINTSQGSSDRLRRVARMAQQLENAGETLTPRLRQIVRLFGETAEASDDVSESVQTQAFSLGELTEAQKKSAAAVRARVEEEQRWADLLDSMNTTQLPETGAALAALGVGWVNLSEASNSVFDSLETVRPSMDDLRGLTDDLAESTSPISDLFTSMGESFKETFVEMIVQTKGFEEGFADIWKSIKAGFARVLTEMLGGFVGPFLGEMAKAIGGAKFGSIVGKVFGGGATAAISGGATAAGGAAGGSGAAAAGGGSGAAAAGGGSGAAAAGGGSGAAAAGGGLGISAGGIAAGGFIGGAVVAGIAIFRDITRELGFDKQIREMKELVDPIIAAGGVAGLGEGPVIDAFDKAINVIGVSRGSFAAYSPLLQEIIAARSQGLFSEIGANKVNMLLAVRGRQRADAALAAEEQERTQETGMLFGRHGLIGDFGAGTPVTLHGMEAVIPLDQLTTDGGSGPDMKPMEREIRMLRADWQALPETIREAMRDGVMFAIGSAR